MSTIAELENKFMTFLDDGFDLDDFSPFLRTYLRLLRPYDFEISPQQNAVLVERNKQMNDVAFDDSVYESARLNCRREMDSALANGCSASRNNALNRMIFCALSDSPESDVFYLIEPIFDFARSMKIKVELLAEILYAEFPNFS